MIDTATDTSTSTTNAGEPQTADTTAGTNPQGDASTQTAETTKATEPVVPEAYEFTMPEGVELDKAAADEFSAVAKELKLDNATAQKVADVGARMAQRQAEQHAKLVESWVEEVKTDREIGGDKLDENLGIARQAMDAFGSPELKELLNRSGLGNHPAVVKAFYNAGKRISTDRMVTGTPRGGDTDTAKKLFPNMN